MERGALLVSLVLVSYFIQATFHIRGAGAVDVDSILDYCVVDLTNTNVSMNGLPCNSPTYIASIDFKSFFF